MIGSIAGGSRGRRAISTGRPRRRGPSVDGLGRPVRAGFGVGPALGPGIDLERCVTRFWEVREARPPAWRRKAFRRWVDLIRQQLAPIGGVTVLAASFAREAALLGAVDEPDAAVRGRLERSPLVVAYVVRWLELHDRVELPPWRDLAVSGEPTDRPTARP